MTGESLNSDKERDSMNRSTQMQTVSKAVILRDFRWDAGEAFDLADMQASTLTSGLVEPEHQDDCEARHQEQLAELVTSMQKVQGWEIYLRLNNRKVSDWKRRQEIEEFLTKRGIDFALPAPMPKAPSGSYDESLMQGMHILWDA
jgi:hypothetical protein